MEPSYIVNHFDDCGSDFDEEFFDKGKAIEFLRDRFSEYYEMNGSMMAEPTLSHPDGSGRLYDLETENWTEV